LADRKVRFKFHVAPKPPEGADPGWSLIIGTDFCKAAKLNIDYLNEKVCWQGQRKMCSSLLLHEPPEEPSYAVSRQPLGDALPPDEVLAYTTGCAPEVAITAKSQRADPELARIIKVFQTVQQKRRQNQPLSAEECQAYGEMARQYHVEDGALYRIYFPAKDEPYEGPALLPCVPSHQRAEVFRLVHDDTANGCHQGREKTFQRMRRHFHFPRMRSYVDKMVDTCESCQLAKTSRQAKYGTLKPIAPAGVFEQISMDVLDATERGASGARWILAIQDSASAFLRAVPLKDMTSDTAAAVFKQVWLEPYGPPQRVITDNGSNLAKGRMKELFDLHEIKLATTEPGRAQGNGRAERAVQTVKNLLIASGKEDARQWDERLKEAVNAYNAATQASTGFAPAQIVFGTIPSLRGLAKDSARRKPFHNVSLGERMAQRALVREAAADNVLKAQARQKSYFDRKRRVLHLEPGSLVRLLLDPKSMAKKRKFRLPWAGPYEVVEEKYPDVYILKHPRTGKKVRRTVNVERLAPFHSRKQPSKLQQTEGQEAARETSSSVSDGQRPGPPGGSFESDEGTDDVEQETSGLPRQEIVPTEDLVSGTTRAMSPDLGIADLPATEQDAPEMQPSDQVAADTTESQSPMPDTTEADTVVPQDPELPEMQPEVQVASDRDMAAPLGTELVEPQADVQASSEQTAHGPVETQPESPTLRTRSGRAVRPPSRYWGQEDYRKPSSSNMVVRAMSTMMHGLMRRLPMGARPFREGRM